MKSMHFRAAVAAYKPFVEWGWNPGNKLAGSVYPEQNHRLWEVLPTGIVQAKKAAWQELVADASRTGSRALKLDLN